MSLCQTLGPSRLDRTTRHGSIVVQGGCTAATEPPRAGGRRIRAASTTTATATAKGVADHRGDAWGVPPQPLPERLQSAAASRPASTGELRKEVCRLLRSLGRFVFLRRCVRSQESNDLFPDCLRRFSQVQRKRNGRFDRRVVRAAGGAEQQRMQEALQRFDLLFDESADLSSSSLLATLHYSVLLKTIGKGS